MKISKALALFSFIGILFGLLIYLREYSDAPEVRIFHVLLWQIVIWFPWTFSFKVFERIIENAHESKFEKPILLVSGILCVALHFGWFFIISSNFSPYIGENGSGFGVFPYFFIFWTLFDVGIVLFVVNKLRWNMDLNVSKGILLELTRGKTKHFCEPSQICLLASENYYTKLFTTEGVFVMRKPLKHFQDILPDDVFKRVHRSTIINVNYVSELTRGVDNSLEVVMKDGARRRVSRNFTKEIIHYFKDRVS